MPVSTRSSHVVNDPIGQLDRWMSAMPRGHARALFTDDIEAVAILVSEAAEKEGTVVAHRLTQIPTLELVFLRCVEALSNATLRLWPSWYGRRYSATASLLTRASAPAEISAIVETVPGVLQRWLESACDRAREGHTPFSADLPLAVQARQLALAIDPDELWIALVVAQPQIAEQPLHSLSRAAEWLARQAGARLIVVLPSSCRGSLALDPISPGAFCLDILAAEPAAPDQPRGDVTIVRPVLGRPHPLSEPEQRLARTLARDEELARLFTFNQRIRMARGTHAVVDLLWKEGRVIVELDGWETHGNRVSFAADRHRDYELLLSGYLVLRLTNGEVVDDAEKAVDKIRDLVRFRLSVGRERATIAIENAP